MGTDRGSDQQEKSTVDDDGTTRGSSASKSIFAGIMNLRGNSGTHSRMKFFSSKMSAVRKITKGYLSVTQRDRMTRLPSLGDNITELDVPEETRSLPRGWWCLLPLAAIVIACVLSTFGILYRFQLDRERSRMNSYCGLAAKAVAMRMNMTLGRSRILAELVQLYKQKTLSYIDIIDYNPMEGYYELLDDNTMGEAADLVERGFIPEVMGPWQFQYYTNITAFAWRELVGVMFVNHVPSESADNDVRARSPMVRIGNYSFYLGIKLIDWPLQTMGVRPGDSPLPDDNLLREGGRGITETERHDGKLVVPKTRTESGLRLVLLGYADLVISATKIDLREKVVAGEAIEQRIRTGHRINVSDRIFVETAVIEAEAESVILLAIKEDRCTPWGRTRFNEALLKQLVNLAFKFLGFGNREAIWGAMLNTVVRFEPDVVLDIAHRRDAAVRDSRRKNIAILAKEGRNARLQSR
ncbi:hypothetical protein CBR_g19054 [Chara braunii]|uniref:Uncharacterized protein n=1 Tax=Chara braunii TaxID=69332 RepID=A0A388KX81_CHABU|nr:hypothetical protein CBR_g19054 [Chara braunii]|eukprot:GBG74647.1 hypothetical protein CBR_g19054 [Chara braunii]